MHVRLYSVLAPALLLLAHLTCFTRAAVPLPPDAVKSTWEGYERIDFKVEGRDALLVFPRETASGKPWIWRTEFFGHEPQADMALLGRGFHVAYMDVQNLYGAPKAIAAMDRLYEELTGRFGLSARPVLEGLSRGGLFALNWGARYADRCAALYLDAPVCDFKSWPAGWGRSPGSADDWVRCKAVYGVENDEAAKAYTLNPVDNLRALAAARIPILSVCGEADRVVPYHENSGVVYERYRALDGPITVILKPGVDHHPHSLKDPRRIVDFILRAVDPKPLAPGELTGLVRVEDPR
jgi:pimeloyl-ACP methyl ester carboxylesterase